ncbi:MAG: succinate dehydrogenase/fumarate reductase cytochrome b subunit [Bacteroidetes bacterium HGW-Bacteroidetes-10]|jgi:succinate dehydrogenase / fumarate reductase cytochrome b subunit|nr:MAG: succinate dehydrogenase/fumarate reductase cytochrome b subunit [Bacteroidetes bacterium HGW-Bacteroidetes-10]
MANIFTSSIGKKLIMSISGLFLILFLLVHLLANSAYLFGPEAFDLIIVIMGSPVVVAMVPLLAAGFAVHIAYALILNRMNMKARGTQRYEVTHKGEADSWASKNMLILGLIVLGFLVFHLSHFWAKMQLPEFTGGHAEDVNDLMHLTFGNPYIFVCYLVWFTALWFHLTHGFWSALQTIGMNNTKWLTRLKAISYVYATVVCGGFVVIAVTAFLRANGYIG